MSAGLLVTPPLALSPASRRMVDHAIRGVCTHRQWKVHALEVRSNHVHLVVTGGERPERIMGDCKSWGTRALRQARVIGPAQVLWTRHGSTIYLWTSEKLAEKIAYVLECQDKPERFSEPHA